MIDGEWRILAVDYGGETVPARTGSLQILGPRFALQVGGAPREVGAVEHDPAAEPATLDLVWRHPDGAEARRLRAIVRRRGDLLQVCYFPTDTPGRPTAFDSRASGAIPPAILVRCRLVIPPPAA
jgi:uncharacterized protein (TIGR03067 family)